MSGNDAWMRVVRSDDVTQGGIRHTYERTEATLCSTSVQINSREDMHFGTLLTVAEAPVLAVLDSAGSVDLGSLQSSIACVRGSLKT